jgi:flavin reductase (DIM6/NTAB) family NADH-FMN oxidoreductase RutF
MAIDPREFRNTLGCFATGVTVITTTDANGKPVGLTANSFTSVSLDPPMVLFCLDRKVASFEAFNQGGGFAVNILTEEQKEISNRFATSGDDKWEGVSFDTWDGTSPIIPNSLANMECRVSEIFEGGDHIIILGKVTRIASGEATPLLYWRGQYATIDSQ